MDQKLKFIARYLEGEKIAPLCKEFGISRPTAHKLIKRYKTMGECALVELSEEMSEILLQGLPNSTRRIHIGVSNGFRR